MIWESIFLMTVIDVFILSAVLAAVWILAKNKSVFAQAGVTFGAYPIVLGLLTIGLLYLTDLFIMYALPPLTSEASAHAVMEDLHLNYSWWCILLGTTFICVGLVTGTHRLLPMTNRLQFTQFAMDRASDCIYWMTADARFFYINDAACLTLGYTRDELLSRSVHDIDPDFPADVWPRFWQEVRERGSFVIEAHHRTKEGRVFPVEIRVNYLHYQGREFNCSIVRDISERKRVEAELREREQQLLHTLEDREAISQDLHDGILQSLYAVGLGLETCKTLMPNDPQRAVQEIDGAIRQLNALLAEVRGYITDLDSDLFLQADFGPGLERLASRLVRTTPMQVHLDIDPLAAAHLTRQQAVQLLYMVNECLSNSVRHAQAQGARVTLNREDNQVLLEVQDDGVGFDVEARRQRGYGLSNLARRAQKVGGHFKVSSKPGHGTHIKVALPYRREADHSLH